jgi:hypothetical protein
VGFLEELCLTNWLLQAFHNKAIAHTKTQPQNIQRSFIGGLSYGARQHWDNKERDPWSTFAVVEQLNASANSGMLNSTDAHGIYSADACL